MGVKRRVDWFDEKDMIRHERIQMNHMCGIALPLR